MTLRFVTYDQHPELLEAREWGQVWPKYNGHGDVMAPYWSRRYDVFPEFQFFLYDDERRIVLAKAHSAPSLWDRTIEGLPDGIDDVLVEAFELRASNRPGNVLSALAVEIPAEHQGKGISALMVQEMAALAHRHGLGDLIAPVRPSWKERYPLAPIERYALWMRADGLPFDPWIRVHHRLGGEILKAAPQSLRITGSVGEWEEWTEMVFPESGTYVFPRGLAPLEINSEQDLGSYWEPNVWVRHRAEGPP
jgi:GNAT superfamily N-acetyltransferase